METIAVYWEETIRTYGLQMETALCCVQADIRPGHLETLGRQLADLGKTAVRFRLMLAHPHNAGMRLNMVCEGKWKDLFTEPRPPLFSDGVDCFRVEYPVEMLTFHGPHYGDRYGIAHKACRALQKEDIRYIAMGCSAASVHFVFPEHSAQRAASALGTVFKTPVI